VERLSDMSERPVIVMLHAFPCDHTLWSDQAQALTERGFDVHVPDLPGFGASSELPLDTPDLGAVVRSLRKRYPTPVILVGLSIGGYLAMEWLRQEPDQIRGLGLVGTKASADSAEAIEKRLRLAQMVEEDPASTARVLSAAMTPTLVMHPERPEVTAALTRWFHAVSPVTVAWYQRAMAARPASFDDLARFTGPSLVVWGSGDVLSPETDQQAMCAVLNDVAAVEIPDAGHLCALEQPTLMTQVLVDFLESSFPRR